MTTHQFEKTMREMLRKEPFEPFTVRTDSNEIIVIENPQAVALAAGGAGYIGSEHIHFIESVHVTEIRSMNS